ncbi:hypothetical protein F5Y04DRAFT_148464 [Hypomontagnella monticulosa]|nr:hypothetical protein F5Y04DRAFT_148464 [Hypomontagnella monticulosa]
MGSIDDLPDSNSPNLGLDHPTPNECAKIWTNTSASWKDALTVTAYLTESQYLTTVPLAKNGGMTTWILVDKGLRPDERPILCSCESFRKRSLTSDAEGMVEETIIHGIASVFCPPEYRGRGYAARHMTEVARMLPEWQSEYGRCVGSVLYSDIGKTYYRKFGWNPTGNNSHLVLPPIQMKWPTEAREVIEEELEGLCQRDEAMVRAVMAMPLENVEKRVTILPDLDHMLWHIRKEDFATRYIFGNVPQAKGAIAGKPGCEAWAIWTRRYYRHPDEGSFDNVLYILRLVLEGDETANKPYSSAGVGCPRNGTTKQLAALRAVLQAAQAEAAKWQLNHIKLWEPSPLVKRLIAENGIEHVEVMREKESIASGLWYDENGAQRGESPAWINNEYYAWC